ncbi:hypothetical protein [Neobacillus sp. FSL H8-0543]|uniref:hypothetical protein n=1 Tax=Neobacillus sp. FSL H8-0543 TaxID=2954672 RepID=UPI003157FC8E
MEKTQAVFLAKHIEKSSPLSFEIKKLVLVSGTLPKFHQWTNGKKVVAGYEITQLDSDTSYYFLFIDWHRNDNYYLVIYTHNKSTTVAEIRQVEEIDGLLQFVWSYNPLKRDGKNDQRKAYFKQMFGTTTVHIKLPTEEIGVERFCEQMFKLCLNRMTADRIVDIFDSTN